MLPASVMKRNFTLISVLLGLAACVSNAATILYTQDFQTVAHETTNPDGWDGASRAFGPDTSVEGGANDRALIATGVGNYTTRREITVAVQPNTTYTLSLDAGTYSSGTPREVRYIYGLGTWNGSVYTEFSSPSEVILEQDTVGEYFFQSGNETSLPSYQFTTGSSVSGDNLMIRLRAEDIVNNAFGGWDSIVVTAVPEPSSTALLGLGGLALILRRRKG